jgi:hypothetical protein
MGHDSLPARSGDERALLPAETGGGPGFDQVVERLTWRRCRPEYAAQVGDHEYVVRHKTCDEEAFAVLTGAIWGYGRRERYLVTGNTFTYFVRGAYRYWTAPGWDVINRAVEADLVGKYEPADLLEAAG